jgi:hypothetical protein
LNLDVHPDNLIMTKSKNKAGGTRIVDFLHRTFEHSARSAEEHKALLETRRTILRKLLLRMGKNKSGDL